VLFHWLSANTVVTHIVPAILPSLNNGVTAWNENKETVTPVPFGNEAEMI
jgi:hypothetical protein